MWGAMALWPFVARQSCVALSRRPGDLKSHRGSDFERKRGLEGERAKEKAGKKYILEWTPLRYPAHVARMRWEVGSGSK